MPSAPIKRNDMYSKIRAIAPKANISLGDSLYLIIKQKWLKGSLYDYYLRWLSAMKVDEWNKRWDCDDYATLFRMSAQGTLNNSKQSHAKQGQALAIGEFWYRSGDGGHAINIAFCEGYKPIFIEPQSGEILDLTLAEIESAWHVRF